MMSGIQSASQQSKLLQAAECCAYGAGIIGFLVVYGLIQERIMTLPYDGAVFTASVFLVFCNRFVAIIYAFCMMLAKQEAKRHQAPIWKYACVSVSNVAASSCQYEALKYVSFPVQMLGKSFKMMPVMLWGIAISGKSYKLKDWAIAGVITFGVVMFLMTGSISSSHSTHAHSSFWGLLLLVVFLACDGLTSSMQEKVFKEHNTSKYNQMFYINLCSAVISIVTLLITRNLFIAIAFCVNHPRFIADAIGLSAAAVAGQWCIYSQVKEFGALVFAATMNVRQVVSILISYIKYGHSITVWQVVALIFVFGALFYKSVASFGDDTGLKKTEKDPLLADERKKVELHANEEGKNAKAQP